MSRRKKSKAVPVVLLITVLAAALAVGCFLVRPMITDPLRKASEADLRKQQEEVARQNAEIQAKYEAEIRELKSQKAAPTSNPSWPEHKSEGWDVIDLTNYPLENQTAVAATRAQLMNGGMLLVNAWHSRPADFDETVPVSVSRYLGSSKIQTSDYNVKLVPAAADALMEALTAAKAEGLEHYLVDEGFRSYEEQNTLFTKRMEKLSGKYEGDALVEAAKKEVNYPGTSEFNTGLSFVLRLYEKGNAEISKPKYSTTDQAKWLNRNCWKYGLVIRFPQAGWPLEETQDKSFKTGISSKMNLYRYVGKGNAAVMHYFSFCLEEYVEYLQEHPHIAVFEDGVLKYEIYREYVGDADSFNLQLTRNAPYSSSLDNMGAVITVFSY